MTSAVSLADLFGCAGAALDAPSVSSSSDHAGARAVVAQAFRNVTGREASQTELQAIQAIAHMETGYGQFSPFAGSHNWGAVQALGTYGKDPSEMGPDVLPWHDTHPNPDGTSTTYSVGFRKYPDDVAGASDTVRELTIRRPKTFQALGTGDADLIAAAMRLEKYYEGKGATEADRVANYAKAISSRAKQIAAGLGEPILLSRRGGTSPTERPSTQDAVPLNPSTPAAMSIALPLAALLGAAVIASRSGESGADVLGNSPASSSALPKTDTPELVGDWLPTLVTPDDARRYIRETDSAWQMTAFDVASSKLPDAEKSAWNVDLTTWNQFRDEATKNVGWLNTKATMEQTDRWSGKLILWRQALTKAGAALSGPLLDPGQGLPSQGSGGVFSAGWIQLALVVAALFAAGYLVRSFKL